MFSLELIARPAHVDTPQPGLVFSTSRDLSRPQGLVLQYVQNKWQCQLGDGKSWVGSAQFDVIPDIWNYVVLSIAGNTLQVFVNGEQRAQTMVTGSVVNPPGGPLLGDWTAPDKRRGGILSEMRFCAPLTPKEIRVQWTRLQQKEIKTGR